METNFFQQVKDLQLKGELHIIIGRGADDNMVVSLLLKNEQCGDSAKHLIPPLILRESASELDKQFFSSITSPMQSTSQLMVNMESFLKQQEMAKQQSAMEKEKTEKVKKEKEERDKKYNEAMKKVDELEKEGKYRDAWVKVPEPNLYPEHMEAIQKRRSALAAKFSSDLFATPIAMEEPVAMHQDEDLNEEPSGFDTDPDYDDDNLDDNDD